MEHLIKGLTLVELCISLAIISILAMAAAPSFSTLSATNRRSNYLSALNNQLYSARSYAIINSENVTVCPFDGIQCTDTWSGNQIILFTDRNKDAQLNGNEAIIHLIEGNNLADRVNYPRRALTFRPDGVLNGLQNGSFVYCSSVGELNKPAKLITVSQQGRVRTKSLNNKC